MKKETSSKTTKSVEQRYVRQLSKVDANGASIFLSNGDVFSSSNDLLFKTNEIFIEDLSLNRPLNQVLNWPSFNIGLEILNFDEIRERAISEIAHSENPYMLKVFGEFNSDKKTKICLICKNINEALLAQALFTLPTRTELSNFGVEDYTIIINIDNNENATIQNNINANVETKEIVISGQQPLENMGIGIFNLLNRLMK